MELVILDITNVAVKYLPIAILIGISISILSNNLQIFLQRRRVTNHAIYNKYILNRFLLLTVFYTYCFIVICLTLLTREPGSRFDVRLQIFRIFSGNYWDKVYAIENVIMFVPLGFMLPFISSKFDSIKIIIFIGFISSLAIEVIQYITKRGFTELDDILNNVIGIIIGYLCINFVKVVHLYGKRNH